jgi:hypothetical protein
MIMLWRMCGLCGRRFGQWHTPGEGGMKALCPKCQTGSHAH